MAGFFATLESLLWSWPLLLLILGTGVFFTLRLRGLQFRRLPTALRLIFEKSEGAGDISPFAALCTSLSATIGTGNIVGVATALALGGPGALLWMEVSAVTGMALKYAEGFLAVKYRAHEPDGSVSGGPFRYMEQGLGHRWRPVAKIYAFLGAAAGICGFGTFVQINSITSGLQCFLAYNRLDTLPVLPGLNKSVLVVVLGLLLTLLAGCVILGGIARIARVASVLVPAMAGLFLAACLWVIGRNLSALPQVLREVFAGAFRFPAVAGGAVGGLLVTMQAGISRGIFSNEAGLGTSSISDAAAKTDSPVKQGLVSMSAVFFDTIVMCTITALTILLTRTHQQGISPVGMTMVAFSAGLPLPAVLAQGIVVVSLVLFAFTTVIGWNYHGVQCVRYLSGDSLRVRNMYQYAYIGSVLLAPYLSMQTVWTVANIANGLMVIPNLLALLLLSGTVVGATRQLFRKEKPWQHRQKKLRQLFRVACAHAKECGGRTEDGRTQGGRTQDGEQILHYVQNDTVGQKDGGR